MLREDEILEDLNGKKIIQKKDGFKFGIDTVVLFKLAEKSINKSNSKILDIGTGNGVLPLFLSENKYLDEIIGIDIQEENIERAKKNLKINNIGKNITFEYLDAKEYKKGNYFDYVISNPPYMELNGKKINDNLHRAISRHEIQLNLDEFISLAKKFLKPIGTLFFVHRTHRLVEIIKKLDEYNFSIKKIVFIYPEKSISSIMFVEAIKGKKVKIEIENYYISEENS